MINCHQSVVYCKAFFVIIFNRRAATLYFMSLYSSTHHSKLPCKLRLYAVLLSCYYSTDLLGISSFFIVYFVSIGHLYFFIYLLYVDCVMRNKYWHLLTVSTIYFLLRKHDNWGCSTSTLFNYLTFIWGYFNYLQVVSISFWKAVNRTNTKNVDNKLSVFKSICDFNSYQ